jgi:hypothetical protein
VAEASSSTQDDNLQHEYGRSGPSRVASVRDILIQTGFSDTVAARISPRNRTSTNRIYQSRLSAFETWRGSEGVDPLKAPVPLIADFLLSLFSKGFEVDTIKGYRSAIAAILKHKGRSIGSDKNISDLIARLALERPAYQRSIPSWDLPLVLKALTRPPFEPIGKTEVKYLSFKTVFLLALATGSRVS